MKTDRVYFSVSPDIKFWEKEKPILLAGKWCLDFDEENSKNLNFTLLKNKFFEIEESEKEVDFCNSLYEKILPEISNKLNGIHKLKWSARSWRIMIGPWLNRYIAVINNRLNILQEAKKNFNIDFKKIDFEDETLISKNIVDFSNKAVSMEWNEKLIRRLHLVYDKDVNKDYFCSYTPKKFEEKKQSLKEKFLSFFGFKINYLVSKFFVKKNNYIFNKIYLGDFFTTLKLFFKLKQFPLNFFFNENIPNEPFNSVIRKNFIFEITNTINIKEKVINRSNVVKFSPLIFPIIIGDIFFNFIIFFFSH